ncbi:MAG: hypothetical protein U0350_49715 [Caldilineaceae bacterium]
MMNVENLTRRFETVFDRRQSSVLAETITEAYSELVKTSDFNELKAIVKEIAEAQQRLVERQDRLTEAQERTEVSISELVQAQKQTERLVAGIAQELGGLSRSMSYSLENEAYRNLPALLQTRYGITLDEKLVRLDLDGEEINLFARGTRNGQPIYLVGESKLQLDERRNSHRAAEAILNQLDKKAGVVQRRYPDVEIVRILLTHYARPAVLQQAEARGVIVIQSFEW